MFRPGYSTTQAAELTRLTERQLRHLARRGLIGPSVREPEGRGSLALYSIEDLIRLKVIEALTGLGGGALHQGQCERVLDALGDFTGDGVLIIDQGGAWIASGTELDQLLELPAASIVVLDRVQRDLTLAMRRAGLGREVA